MIEPRQKLLRSIGLLPADSVIADFDDRIDLLPILHRQWDESSASRKQSRKASATMEWIDLARSHGYQMTFGVDAPDENRSGNLWRTSASQFSNRLVLWPVGQLPGVLEEPWTSIMSSRLGRTLEDHAAWFDAFRTACVRLSCHNATVLTAASTTCDAYVRRAAALFGLRVLAIDLKHRESPNAWLRRTRNLGATTTPTAFVSPPLDGSATKLPVIDQTLSDLSDRVIALRVRRDGNLHGILSNRLSDASRYPGVFVVRGDGLASDNVADELQDQGAVNWHLLGNDTQDDQLDWTNARVVSSPIIPVPEANDWVYLTHCTRRRTGPWPDQQPDDYMDDLILDRRGKDHDCFAAVCRIAKHKRLYASAESIRGTTPVVCFSAVGLDELKQRRVFRSHRGRWDFEPYGICIRQQWLKQVGARPVIYGDDADWSTLPTSDRPFFQVAASKAGSQPVASEANWSAEREWRFVGDLDLSDLPSNEAFVFVPSATEARNLAMISSWPVALVSPVGIV